MYIAACYAPVVKSIKKNLLGCCPAPQFSSPVYQSTCDYLNLFVSVQGDNLKGSGNGEGGGRGSLPQKLYLM